ncbi:MAG: hypothetical protein AOA66_1730 [Candidatus Bathyarchaeota archaeon BA2]|nr:MAG: hypothetical protein AOA66_1730 [Candidatus Bathyarchaeota archaeon BA2]
MRLNGIKVFRNYNFIAISSFTVIRDTFRKLQQPLLDKAVENLATIGQSEKNLLLAMIRSSLYEREKVKPDDLKIAYHAIFGETMKEGEYTAHFSSDV